MFTKLSPSVIRVASRRLRRPMTARLCPFLLRRGRVICSTVCEADSRLHRSCSDYRSSVPLCRYRRRRVRNGATCVNAAFDLPDPDNRLRTIPVLFMFKTGDTSSSWG
jgi:hypothetical protein